MLASKLVRRQIALRCFSSSSPSCGNQVNSLYQPGVRASPLPKGSTECTRSPCVCLKHSKSEEDISSVLKAHSDDKTWSKEDLSEATKHVLFTWGASEQARSGSISISRGEGVYFYDTDGKKYLDFNSQAMCLSMGHSPSDAVIQAVSNQMKELTYAYPGISSVPIRSKLAKLLSDIAPGDINTFMFPSSGAESNEAAIRMAKKFTGRKKIFSRYRSYHGATLATMTLTGDFRRWPTEPGMPGVVHFFDPYPYSLSWGESEEEITTKCLTMLEEQIKYENPNDIAGIIMESITGTNGFLQPPKGYLEGVRALCDKYGIVMICDEVMAGFGRSGKLFGFCHANIVPDIVTFAKGVNSGYMSLGGVGVRDHISKFFNENPVGYGSTYNGHPVAIASAYAVLKEMLAGRVIQNAANMEEHLVAGMQSLIDKHPSVKQARCVGLFGGFDIQKNKQGDFISEVHQPPSDAMNKFKKALLDNGLFTMIRGHQVCCNPPLIINKEQIEEGISVFDKCLPILDEAMED